MAAVVFSRESNKPFNTITAFKKLWMNWKSIRKCDYTHVFQKSGLPEAGQAASQ